MTDLARQRGVRPREKARLRLRRARPRRGQRLLQRAAVAATRRDRRGELPARRLRARLRAHSVMRSRMTRCADRTRTSTTRASRAAAASAAPIARRAASASRAAASRPVCAAASAARMSANARSRACAATPFRR